MFSISNFDKKGLPYQFVSEDKVHLFAQNTPKITPKWTSYYPIFLCYAQHMSYFNNAPFTKAPKRCELKSYVEKYESKVNEGLTSSCLGSGLFIASKILHTEERNFNIESDETECIVSLTQYLFNGVAVERIDSHTESKNRLTSVKSKANQSRNLFSEIILGLKPICYPQEKPIEISSLEEILKSHLKCETTLVKISISIKIGEGHAIFFLSDMNKHFMIDINLPIIQFSTKESLLKWAPQIVRTFYSNSNEIPDKHLNCILKNQLKTGLIHHSVKKIEGLFVFQKVKYQNPSFTRKNELIEYTKAVWLLPYEKEIVKLEDNLAKIKIQRIIYLINKAFVFKEFQAPLYLSPLTAKGTKVKIIETLNHSPIESHDQGDRFIRPIIDKIDLIKIEDGDNQQDLFVKVLNMMKEGLGENLAATEMGFAVHQFRFGKELEQEDIPLI